MSVTRATTPRRGQGHAKSRLGGPRKTILALTVLSMCAVLSAVGVSPASAVDGVSSTPNFELEVTNPLATGAISDPNAVASSTLAGDDWENVYNRSRGSGTADTANASRFLTDGINSEASETLFTGGQSKDPENITSWRWASGSGVQDKNDIEHAYAARYNATSANPAYLFFGLDRYATDGSATLGFWFLRGKTAPVTVNGVRRFSGTGHQNNDLLVQINYSNGGTVPTVAVSKWLNGALSPLASSDAALCGASSTQTYCASTNRKSESSPWVFALKGASGDSDFAERTFFEGGINLAEFGLDRDCFSTFVAETRSSNPFTSTLSDFVMGDFASCTASMTTTPSANETTNHVAPGTSVTDTATILGSGAANAPSPSSAATAPGKGNKVSFYLCGPIDSPATCSSTTNLISSNDLTPTVAGTSTATSAAVNTAASPLAPGRYCWHATWGGDENYPAITGETNAGAECFAVSDTTTATSAQDWLPNDSATITSGSASTTVAGTIAIALYESADCGVAGGDTPVSGQTYTSGPLSGTGSITYSTSNATYKVLATRSVSWKVTFTSSNPLVGNSTHCERTSLTVTN
ncbi:MAG TPA: hypothetical protein VMZ11_02090 [Mycobacteriales bacterium]|nr:hypothetical protein [Mycobacteriales bacterium]